MSTIRIPHGSVVLVCDGAKALILRNRGDAELTNLIPLEVESEYQPPARELGTDRGGRVYQSQGGARSAVQQMDWHDRAEEAFVSHVCEKLVAFTRDVGINKLVLVLPPHALGLLRKQLDSSARALVIAEVAKDLVKFPIPEIERYLSQ
ncbi:host attachment protein [Sinorhizobium sp. 7-81]|uniref:host attachment protein n=1 Tax=Sinorhizobium sp. 8-89 TaxID=3049089 RepID=UPI0024C3B435|nr:host attachment protein [Sinorhizobium sp. 8-89]MDK1491234.1 host attachment protein [Sinorhizobium sp. 8-89]